MARPGEVPQLQHQAAHQAEVGAGEVSQAETEQQAGKLTVAKPESLSLSLSFVPSV